MGPILYSFATLLAWTAAIAIYHLAAAFAGRFLGVRVLEVSIGRGPTIYERIGKNWTFRVAAIPLGGYTRFHDFEDSEMNATTLAQDLKADQAVGRFRDAPLLAQILIILSGPLAAALVGAFLLAIPVWAEASQLEACSPAESLVHPCGVQGLTLLSQSSCWQSQWGLFRDTVLEFLIRLVTFQSLDGWGGVIAFLVTGGLVGTLSFTAWISSIGVLLLGVGMVNLLPVPGLNGFSLLWVLARIAHRG